MEVTPEALGRFFEVTLPHLNELQRRVVAGAAAQMLGRGGKTAVAKASGMSRNTVIKAQGEVAAGIEPSARLRQPGGGDKPLSVKQPGLLEALDELVHPDTRANLMSLLRWTSKSSTNLAKDLVLQGFEVSSRTVLRLLEGLGYSLQANAKVTEGARHADRDAQFRYRCPGRRHRQRRSQSPCRTGSRDVNDNSPARSAADGHAPTRNKSQPRSRSGIAADVPI